MQNGYFPLWRKFKENRYWEKKRVFSEFEAWLDIMTEARYQEEPNQVLLGLTLIECKRGQCVKSLETWGKRWKWTRSKVRRFFEFLKDDKKICTESVSKTTRLTVCNYNTYNDPRPDGDHMATTSRPQKNKERNKEDKIKKPIKKKTGFDPLNITLPENVSEELWSMWVKHRIEINKPLTEQAVTQQLKKLVSYGDEAPEAISTAIQSQWSTFFPTTRTNNKPPKKFFIS